MERKLIIDGNAVYEIDEGCMLGQRVDKEETAASGRKEQAKIDKPQENKKRDAGHR